MAILYPNWYDQVYLKDSLTEGVVFNAGGKITAVYTGTTNVAPVYNESDSPISQPVIIGTDGRAQFKLDAEIHYDITIVDSNDGPIDTHEDVYLGGGGSGGSGNISGTLTAGKVPVASGAETIVDSSITDDGSTVTLSTPLDVANNPIVNTEYQDFDLTPTVPAHVEGRQHWDETDGTISVDLANDVSLQVGQETLIKAKNGSGVDNPNGSAVYITGSSGQRVEVNLAEADNSITSRATIGIATQDVGANNTGFYTTFGLVRDIDTSGFNEGDSLFLGTTPGEIVNVPPTKPNRIVFVGVCVRAHATEGSIYVKVSPSFYLNELSDVSADSPVDQDILVWNAATSLYELVNLSTVLDPIYEMDRKTLERTVNFTDQWAKLAEFDFTGNSLGYAEMKVYSFSSLLGQDGASATVKIHWDNGAYVNLFDAVGDTDGLPWRNPNYPAIGYKNVGNTVAVYAQNDGSKDNIQYMSWSRPINVNGAVVTEYDNAAWSDTPPSASNTKPDKYSVLGSGGYVNVFENLTLGGNAVNDILKSTDPVSTSDSSLVTAGWLTNSLETKKDAHGVYVNEDKEYQSALTYDSSTRTVTVINDTDCWRLGEHFVITAGTSVTHDATYGEKFVIANTDGTLEVVASDKWDLRKEVGIYFVFYVDSTLYLNQSERHHYDRSPDSQWEFHNKDGAYIQGGFPNMADYTLDVSSDVAMQWSLEEHTLADEEIWHNINEVTDTENKRVLYINNGGLLTEYGSNAQGLAEVGGTIAYSPNGSSLVACNSNEYVNYYTLVTPSGIISMPGQNEYDNRTQAITASLSEDYPIATRLIPEFRYLYKRVYQETNGGSFSCKMRNVIVLDQGAETIISGTSAVNGNFQNLSVSENSNLNGATNINGTLLSNATSNFNAGLAVINGFDADTIDASGLLTASGGISSTTGTFSSTLRAESSDRPAEFDRNSGATSNAFSSAVRVEQSTSGVASGTFGPLLQFIASDSTGSTGVGYIHLQHDNIIRFLDSSAVEKFTFDLSTGLLTASGGVLASSVAKLEVLSGSPTIARFGHKDMNMGTSFGFGQDSDGSVYIHAPVSKAVSIRSNNEVTLLSTTSGDIEIVNGCGFYGASAPTQQSATDLAGVITALKAYGLLS